MSSKLKQWIALTTVGVIAVMAAGWMLLVSPKRDEASQVRQGVDAQRTTNAGLQTQLAMLKAQAKTLPQQQAKLARVAAKIPDNPALPALIRALSKAADVAGVELVELSPGQPTAVIDPAAKSKAAGPAGSTGLPATTGTSPTSTAPTSTAPTSTAPTSTAPTSTAPKPTTLSTAVAAGNTATTGVLTAIPLTINVVGSYFQLEQFFDQLESLARAAKVTGFMMRPGTNPMKPVTGDGPSSAETGKVLQTTVTANVYMAVGRGLVPTPAVPAK